MQVRANGLLIDVELRGPSDGPPLLLVMGAGAPMVTWPAGFVDLLAERGFRIVRFDNRDCGRSTGFAHAGKPSLRAAWIRYALGLRVSSPYSIRDMAADAVGVLDALGIARAHVYGISMGGMIAQHLASAWPERVMGLVLASTTSGVRGCRGPALRALLGFMPRSAFPPEPDERARVQAAYTALPMHDGGAERHMLAIGADGDRSPVLRRIVASTHVIHGTLDMSVPVSGGHDLAAKISGATLDVIEGMGHEMPCALWPRFVGGVLSVAIRNANASISGAGPQSGQALRG